MGTTTHSNVMSYQTGRNESEIIVKSAKKVKIIRSYYALSGEVD